MALDLTQGRDVALVRQSATGKFDLSFATSGPSRGNPLLDNTRTHAVLTTLVSWKRGTRPGSQVSEGGYIWDTQNRRGTLIWTVTQDRMATPSQLKAYAEDGMQQLVDSKQIASFTAAATRVRPGQLRVDVSWANPDGTRITRLSLDPK